MKLAPGIYHDEQIAWVAQDILGSFGGDYTSQNITEWIAKWNSDLFDDPLELLEIVDEVSRFLADYGQELLDESDGE